MKLNSNATSLFYIDYMIKKNFFYVPYEAIYKLILFWYKLLKEKEVKNNIYFI